PNMGVPGFNPYGPDPARRPFNWMGWSIFNTIMGLLFGLISLNTFVLLFFGWTLPIFGFVVILGIVGIIFSAQAKIRYKQCDYAGAQSSALVAKIVNIIGLLIILPVIMLVGLILSA
ncbi:MAG: CD225/dispanin family protein, partial [Paramuribaculum sp.]|nr:CD225/dispanin family protein [Paramuribaculum sp.]